MKVQFNRTLLRLGRRMEEPSQREIQRTPSLFNASLEDALLYGGDVTREALSLMEFNGDYKHIIVDTKVHMLMRGMLPAIPGWHTDGVPRENGVPRIARQEAERSPAFHLLVTGACQTEFVLDVLDLEVPDASNDLYAVVSGEVARLRPATTQVSNSRVSTWDWWQIHRAVPAPEREWRYLIRVTETDTRAPKTDLREVLRTQQQAYVVSEAFGW